MANSIIYQGAEAILRKTTYHTLPAVEKRRISKTYRITELDTYLISTRTKEEAKLITEARAAGVPVPLLYDIDLPNGTITMEYINGTRIKDILNTLQPKQQQQLCYTIGENIAKLHNHGLIHGDLTTSNMIHRNNQIYFIDFGLGAKSKDVETQGVDLHVLMEAFESTHSQFPQCFPWVLDSYQTVYKPDAQQVLQKIKEIVKRGRYR